MKKYGQRSINIVQEALNKTTPEKKKSKKAKWFSEEAVQMAEEKREVKSKGEKERCIQMQSSKEQHRETRRPSSMNSS